MDEQEIDYRRTMGLDSKHVTPKERKLTWLSSETGKPKEYWKGVSSKCLSGIIYKQNEKTI
jgi:hypothetical protein